ncbi:MAG: nicotinamide riboside transporter PnuC [Acutalibacteraceae bacterium]
MESKLQKNHKREIIQKIKIALVVVLTVLTVIFAAKGIIGIVSPIGNYEFKETQTFFRTTTAEEEGYDDDSTVCDVEYETADGKYSMIVSYTYEQWETLSSDEVEGYIYQAEDGSAVAFTQKASESEITAAVKNARADTNSDVFAIAIAVGLMAIGFFVMTVWDKFFTTYEKVWFLSILVLASVFSILFPEESCNGINGLWIMVLYLLDTFLNILCELLISKQSRWNFIVSVFVEITEIAICLVLAYRFATMASTLFFWLPIDIASFINWTKHPDRKEEELTKVRKLSGLAEVLIILGIVVWTVGIGYLLTRIDLGTDLFGGNETLEVIVCYLDACVSAVGICNGVFILLRIREQWIAWFIDAILEGVINILSGQYVLLVLKLGYLTNTTYGYIKWTKYIKEHKEAAEDKKLF